MFPTTTTGRPLRHDRRTLVVAILYVLRSGCPWRLLPKDLPPWQTVYDHFATWRDDGTWRRVHDVLRRTLRAHLGRDPEPSAAILDSQSLKTTEVRGDRGYDGAKRLSGRKRHLVMDTLWFIVAIDVHPADVGEREGARTVLREAATQTSRLERIWADQGYEGPFVAWVREHLGWTLETVEQAKGAVGFAISPKRWIVERIFAWISRCRRLSKDYEEYVTTSENWIHLAMTRLMLRQLCTAAPTKEFSGRL